MNNNNDQAKLLEKIQQLSSELATIKLTTKKQTSELFASEERFSLAMRGANDGLWDCNIETDEVYCSPRWKSMLGYDEHELSPNMDTWQALIHPDDKDIVSKQLYDCLNGQTDSFQIEQRLRHKDGHYVFILTRGFKVIRESDNKPIRMVGTNVDITERKEAEAFDNQHASVLEMIAVGSPSPEIYDAIALMYEDRFPGMRCSMLELKGRRLMHGGAPSLPKKYCDAVNGLKNGPSVGSCGTSTYTGRRVLVENIETDPKWENLKQVAMPHGLRSCWSEPIKNSSGKVLGALGMYYNHPALPDEHQLNALISAARLAGIVMERNQAQKRIHQLAYVDELTGVASRPRFYLHAEELMKTSKRHKRSFGLLYIDLDNFKSVNDSLGHDAGDTLLRIIAERLQTTCREIDFVARLSGDEFCILVTELDNDYVLAQVAQRCLDAVAQPIELASRKLTPACSIGIARYPDDGDNFSDLTKAADTSLYFAKESGRNQYAFYKPELTQKAEYRFQVEHYLREAIEQQQLSLVYQPQVDINTGTVVGIEALSRWYHPQLGQVSPVDFIATAERMGMIKPLTEWVLNTACRQAMAWKNQGLPTPKMSVNISPTHFLDEGFITLIKRTLSETGLAPCELELEVTEGLVQTDVQNLSIFKDLQQLGVQLAIDDFGTGYSSFASLNHLEIDCLKIDRYFIDDMLCNEKTLLIVSAMIDMSRKLGYRIIAEGVETTKQLEILSNLGCETAQGYLFSKPVSANEIPGLLNQPFAVN